MQTGGTAESRQALDAMNSAGYNTAIYKNPDTSGDSEADIKAVQDWSKDAECREFFTVISADDIFNGEGREQGLRFVQAAQQSQAQAFAVWMNRVTPSGPGSNNVADVNQRVAEIRAATGLPVWCFLDRMSQDATSQYDCDRRVPAYFLRFRLTSL
jgi:hypothetical protein